MKAILPAAGYATRMWPLTIDKPKSLLEINGKTLINYIIDKICKIKDIDEITVVTNNKFYSMFLEWRMGFSSDKKIEIINDMTNSIHSKLGTVGDINFVLQQREIIGDFLVVNPDNLFSFDLNACYNYFLNKGKSVLGILDVGDLLEASRRGSVALDKDNKIILFKEKDPNPKSSLCSIGIYLFKKEIINFFGEYLKNNDGDRMGDFVAYLYKIVDLYGFKFEDEELFFDVGSINGLEEAGKKWDKN